MKLSKLKPRIATMRARRVEVSQAHRSRERRTTGRQLQDRRLRLWKESPHCKVCERFVLYPDGFEVDHIQPLFKGGEDVESNCQVLCHECHEKKTKRDVSGRAETP